MSNLTFKNVYKIYPGDVYAVKDFNLDVEDKEFVVFVGPSGCGKSTTLRMVAGLEEISQGEIYIGDTLVNDIPPKDRDIAMVFQNYALYPHMTVYDNMAFALKLRKTPKEEIDIKVKEAAEILDIENLLDRKPKALSGGQKQRVALGRAIVRDAKVFLMDEPLSNLDAKLRVQTRTEIIKLHKKLQTTFIYVTHDQTEAMTMGDRIVVMKDGLIQQVATPQEIYENPTNVFVAGFIGSPPMNFLNAYVEEDEGGKPYLLLDNTKIKLSENKGKVIKEKGYLGKNVIMGIRPEDMFVNRIIEESSNEGRKIRSKVDVAEMMGADIYLYFDIEGCNVIAKQSAKKPIKAEDVVEVDFDSDRIHLFDKETERSIVN